MRPTTKGVLFGAATVAIYLLVVVITTPALEPSVAVSIAIQLNWPIISGMGIGIGMQSYLAAFAQRFGCQLKMKRGAYGGNSGGTVLTSFFSFFSLIPLGCCGWWLYAISFLPSIFGSSLSAVLVNYSQPLAYVGLAIIFGFNLMTYFKIRQKQKQLTST
ncbi:MAG: hypothetical protein WAO91_09105 [Candidatus Nitrosotenuis sp.]